MKRSTFQQLGTRRSGFTLIELLVVIAIIAILAAILFPVFAQARAKARGISCLSNTNQLGKSIMMYVQDYDETMPYWNYAKNADGWKGNGHFEAFWFNATYPYNKNTQVLRCPDDNTKLTPRTWFKAAGWSNLPPEKWGLNPALLDAQISYGMTETLHFGEINGSWGDTVESGNDKSSAVTLAALQKPAQTMALADCIGMTGGTIYSATRGWGNLPDASDPKDPSHNCLIYKVAYANQGSVDQETSDMQAYGYSDPCDQAPAKWDSLSRHSLGANLSFCDGHSKWLRNSAIKIDYVMGTQAQ